MDLPPLGINAFMGQDMTNTCFYCYNRFPEFPPHRFRDKCPWYLNHKAAGVCHLNRENRLCFGPEREGAQVIFLQRGSPHGTQVRMKTAGTEFDENIENWPKKEEVSTRTGAVGSLSFVNEDSDEDDVEEIKGYGVVNVYSVTEANAARMGRPEP